MARTFYDVYFSAGGPIGPITPEGRPRPTPRWHMHRVHDHESTGIRLLSGDADTLTGVLDLRCGLHAHNGISIAVNLNEVGGLLDRGHEKNSRDRSCKSTYCCLLVDIGYDSIRRIATSKEVPSRKEGAALLLCMRLL